MSWTRRQEKFIAGANFSLPSKAVTDKVRVLSASVRLVGNQFFRLLRKGAVRTR